MFKKIIVSAILVGLIAILAVGAINRTQAKAYNETGFRQEVEGRVAQGGGQGWGASNRTQSQDGLNAETFGEGQAQISELVELTGQVTSVDSALLLVSAASGETVEIANRAWSFAQEQGFTPQVGDTLALTGFYETDGRLEVSQIENLTSGETLALRDENGRPMWAGRGRRGS